MHASTVIQQDMRSWLRRQQSWIDYALAVGIALERATRTQPDAEPPAIVYRHAQRLNNALGLLLPLLSTAQRPLTLLDMHASTGAIQWAAALLLAGFKEHGWQLPQVRVLSLARAELLASSQQLFAALCQMFPDCALLQPEYVAAEPEQVADSRIDWLAADPGVGSHQALRLTRLVRQSRPGGMLLLSNIERPSLADTADLLRRLAAIGYGNASYPVPGYQLYGHLPWTSRVYATIMAEAGNAPPPAPVFWIARPYTGIILRRS